MKPSEFNSFPFSSVMHNTECEIVAQNIMVILGRTGDTFRELSWKEYEAERMNDEDFSSVEAEYFDKVIEYFKSEDTAKLFSTVWKESAEEKSKDEL